MQQLKKLINNLMSKGFSSMKQRILLEFVFYLVIPLIVWNVGHETIGDYYAMLLTAIPGCIYTMCIFIIDKRYNMTIIYVVSSLLIGRVMDLLSGSAESMLWNTVYISIASIILWIASIIIKKPMGMYFFMDYAYLKGYSQESLKAICAKQELFKYYIYFTSFLIIRDLEGALLKIWFIDKYGVAGFNKIIVYMNINGYIFAVLTFVVAVYIEKKIRLEVERINVLEENKLRQN